MNEKRGTDECFPSKEWSKSEGSFTLYDASEEARKREQKFMALLEATNIDLNDLRRLSWKGIPSSCRATVWKILIGYLPTSKDRRESVLGRKRQEFQELVAQHFTNRDPSHEATYRQISIDIPRTCPSSELFKNEIVRLSLTRILYCWSIRRPASGYVQGINDLVTPFYDVFLSAYLKDEPSQLDDQMIAQVEADCYWCFSKLVDSIQDNYTFNQVGIMRQVDQLADLIKRTDVALWKHFEKEGLQFVQFSFRWMNCMLLREFPLHLVIRMWDTYMAEGEGGFGDFHTYVCGAFLSRFSAQLQKLDFQDALLFLQSPPTQNWSLDDLEILLSEAFMWKSLLHDASSNKTT